MKKLLVIVLLFFTGVSTLNAQAQPDAYTETLREMMKVSGSLESFHAAIDQIFTMYKQEKTAVPDKFWDTMKAEFDSTSINDLTEMLTPVYKKRMSIEDLRAIIAFYNTPVGKKFAKETPGIMQESMQIGREWGMRIGKEMVSKLQENGY